jgi:hypothetical protein
MISSNLDGCSTGKSAGLALENLIDVGSEILEYAIKVRAPYDMSPPAFANNGSA